MKIYHNPKCTKSRQTLALLREHGVEPDVVEYLKTPPSETELDGILKSLGLQPAELARKKEARDTGLDLQSMSRREAIAAMVAHPGVIERPIVVSGRKAVIGRPPEAVLALLE
ncbi:MAG: arsenate reductase (glutaredoxin) [Planctomycetaceae bacterium]